MKQHRLYYILFIILLSFNSFGQDCAYTSDTSIIITDQSCSPVDVLSWDVTWEGVNDAGTAVRIIFDWDDGLTDTITAVEGPDSTFTATGTHTYISENDRCSYRPEASLLVNGVLCAGSLQDELISAWGNDNSKGGMVKISPDVFPICIGNGATMRFYDSTLFNCVPPLEDSVPNMGSRWIRWVYGTSNTMTTGSPVLVDGVARTYPYSAPIIELTGPVSSSTAQSLPITVADDKAAGLEFEVELRYWNSCNSDTTGPYVSDLAVIRIVDLPDPTITEVDTFCEFDYNIILTAVDPGGIWSGPGIVNDSTGEFSPSEAGAGVHTITYEVSSAENCNEFDTEQIVIKPGDDGTITPVDPFCIYDAPANLEAGTEEGTWWGSSGIISTSLGIFDPAIAGPGRHLIAFTTEVNEFNCFGTDTIEVAVVDLPDAVFLTNDSAWCQTANNQTTGNILITGTDSSTFDLILDIRGTRDTLRNLYGPTVPIFLDNDIGLNEYYLVKIIEHHGNNSCATDLFDTLKMEVYQQPEVTLTATYESLCSPAEVVIEADSGYTHYTWRFGDGAVSQTQTHRASHTYKYDFRNVILGFDEGDTVFGAPSADTVYHLLVIAESDNGCSVTSADSIHIRPGPAADFFVSPAIQNFPDSVIYLINLTSLGNWSYEWNFGDGNGDTTKEPGEHRYDTWGFYDVELKSFSPHCRDSITRRVQIMPPPPEADFQPDTTGCPPLEITFRNQSLYADTYIWDFDDGTFSTLPEPTHKFWESKEHHVKLAAFGLSGSDTLEQSIQIHDRPTAQFEVDRTQSEDLKQLFEFTNTSINASYYLWDFGDGNTSPDENPKHMYGDIGSYTVTLYVWSEEDCADTLIQNQLIQVIAGEGEIEFPTAFIWNGSGPTGGRWTETTAGNNIFRPRAVNVDEFSMSIYTRWGEQVFQSNDLYVGWDGYQSSGELASQGVYVFKVHVKYIDGKKEVITGSITFLH